MGWPRAWCCWHWYFASDSSPAAGDTLAIYQTFYLATVFAAWQIGMRPAVYTVLVRLPVYTGLCLSLVWDETIVQPIYLLELSALYRH